MYRVFTGSPRELCDKCLQENLRKTYDMLKKSGIVEMYREGKIDQDIGAGSTCGQEMRWGYHPQGCVPFVWDEEAKKKSVEYWLRKIDPTLFGEDPFFGKGYIRIGQDDE